MYNMLEELNGSNLDNPTPEPDNITEGRLPAIAISHLAAVVKEQTAGLYANRLKTESFITFAWDSAYAGESEGSPQGLEDSAQRIEDIMNAISFLSIYPQVDSNRIRLLSICASGGYVAVTAAVDRRIKATTAVSPIDMSPFLRQGYNGQQDPSLVQSMLDDAARAQTATAQGREMDSFPRFSSNETAYCMTLYAFHPRSSKIMPWNSADKMVSFDGFTRIDMADTNAGEPKELFWIPGASHINLYDKPQHVTPTMRRIASYFHQYLRA
ncbi:Alpha/Beta hydrolase protein [Xylogone sp. PMI_703]|nr:Alpha/Beta hydrolase protein [Xylogone sp. PMI_703]